jgi:hypothetical protein
MCVKASKFQYKHTLVWLIAIALYVVAVGCSDDEGTTDVTEGPLSISEIILRPSAPEPGDTLKATAVLQGGGVPGSFASVKWTKTGGTLLMDNRMSVEWVSPKPSDPSAVERLTCTATNTAGSAAMSVDVFVGESGATVPQDGGEIHLLANGDFYYLHSVAGEAGWDSSDVYLQSGGLSTPVVPGNQRRGAQFVFSGAPTRDPSHAAFAGVDGEGNILNPINVWLIDLTTGEQKPITSDKTAPDAGRRQRYQYPYFSLDGEWITYQGFLAIQLPGTIDTLHAFVQNVATGETVKATEGDTRSRPLNYFPTFSSDQRWLVFVSDKQARDTWELYGQPIDVDGVVDTRPQSTVRFSPPDADGMVAKTLATALQRPTLSWNPNASTPILALVGSSGSDNLLRLVRTNQSGADVIEVPDVGPGAQDLVWSDNGNLLAVSNGHLLYTVSTSGAVTLEYTSAERDLISDMAWSPDGQYIVYRTTRAGESWFELYDFGGAAGFINPLKLKSSTPVGGSSVFADQMAANVRYRADNVVFLLTFVGDSPAIESLDLTGAVP